MDFGRLSKRLPTRIDLAFAVRVTVAAVLALLGAQLLALPMPLWSVLTAVIVNQLSSGQSLRTGTSYFLGTIGGSVYGGAVAVLAPHASEAALLVVLMLAVAPLALYSATHVNMNVVPVSAIIVLLMPELTTHQSPLDAAIDRILEVAVGAAIGLGVALLVIPSSAHSQTRDASARLLEEMAETLADLATGFLDGMTIDAVNRVQDRIGAAVTALDMVGSVAERERSMRLASGAETGSLRRTLLRLRHDLVFFGRAVGQPPAEAMRARLRPPLDDVVAAVSVWLRSAARALRAGEAPPDFEPVQRAIDAWNTGVEALRRDGTVRELSADSAERFFAVSFALGQMRHNLEDLAQVVAEWRFRGR
jgi:uncharacterized membrane protein YccC